MFKNSIYEIVLKAKLIKRFAGISNITEGECLQCPLKPFQINRLYCKSAQPDFFINWTLVKSNAIQ